MVFSKDQHPIAPNIKLRLIAGILISCILVGTIGVITWVALKNATSQIEDLVQETNVKRKLIYEMRITARERNLHLAMSLLVDDPFLVDEQWMKFQQQGSSFLIAREKLKSLNPSIEEEKILEKQRAFSRHAVELQYKLNEQRLSGNHVEAITTLHEEISVQEKVFSALDEILALHEKKNQITIDNILKSQKKTQKAIALLVICVFSIIYLTSTYLIKRLSTQAQDIKNEGIKYKALIEGSIDGILVLNKNFVTDCNNNALKLFGVKSLAELNDIGLDYFSQFKDKNSSIKDKDVFSVVNHALVNNKKQYEWRFINTNEKVFPADVELQYIKIDDIDYVQMIIRDITLRKKHQEELRLANENLEQKVKERTNELEKTNKKMVSLAHSAGMSEVASGVLHNVGNVLNSVNVSSSLIKKMTSSSRAKQLSKIVDIFHTHKNDINDYLTNDEAGKLVLPFMEQLSIKLIDERDKQTEEVNSLIHNIEHIKNIISMQQSYAGGLGVTEKIKSSEVMDDAIDINISSINNNEINLIKKYDSDIEITVDKHKLIQILVNLISNAKHAVVNGKKADKNITLGMQKINTDIMFYVEDDGIGIDSSNIDRIFEFGFKVRQDGHGYGLHHSANAARELGGALTAHSDGLGEGCRFSLIIPIL